MHCHQIPWSWSYICELPCGFLELNPGLLEERSMLLTPRPSLKPTVYNFHPSDMLVLFLMNILEDPFSVPYFRFFPPRLVKVGSESVIFNKG